MLRTFVQIKNVLFNCTMGEIQVTFTFKCIYLFISIYCPAGLRNVKDFLFPTPVVLIK